MGDRQHQAPRGPVRAVVGLAGGVLIVLTATAAPALAAPSTAASPSATAPAPTTSPATAQPSLGIGPGISTSRRPPTSTLGVDAASDSASQVQAVTEASSAPALLPTGVNAGHGVSSRMSVLSEFGAAAALALLVGGLLGYRRRPGAHRG